MDLRTLLDQLNIPYREGGTHQHVRIGWLGLDCPWCQTQSKWHLGVPLGGAVAVCWRCGRHTLVEALRAITGESWRTCQDWVRGLGFVATAHRTSPDASEDPPAWFSSPTGLGPLGTAHKRYLASRGFDPLELERLWGLRGVGAIGPLAWRIWIPIFQGGRLVNWTSRAIGKTELRYRSAGPGEFLLPLKSTLYGQEYAPGPAVIVVEGPTDVWRLGPGAVAVYGTSWTEAQARLLQRYRRRVLCFDAEPAAQQSARKLARRLSGFPGETCIVRLSASDPGSAEPAEIREILGFAFGD